MALPHVVLRAIFCAVLAAKTVLLPRLRPASCSATDEHQVHRDTRGICDFRASGTGSLGNRCVVSGEPSVHPKGLESVGTGSRDRGKPGALREPAPPRQSPRAVFVNVPWTPRGLEPFHMLSAHTSRETAHSEPFPGQIRVLVPLDR